MLKSLLQFASHFGATRSPDVCADGSVKTGARCSRPLHKTIREALHRQRHLLRQGWVNHIVSHEVRGPASMLN